MPLDPRRSLNLAIQWPRRKILGSEALLRAEKRSRRPGGEARSMAASLFGFALLQVHHPPACAPVTQGRPLVTLPNRTFACALVLPRRLQRIVAEEPDDSVSRSTDLLEIWSLPARSVEANLPPPSKLRSVARAKSFR